MKTRGGHRRPPVAVATRHSVIHVSLLARLRQIPTAVLDAVVVVIVGVPTTLDAWWNEPGTRQADDLTYGLTAISILVLFGRRRHPIAVAMASGIALSGLYLLGHHGELLNLPVMVALYSVAVHHDRTVTVIAGVVAAAWSGALGFTSDDPLGARGGSPVLEMIWPLVPLALGEAARSSRELLAHAQAEREREAERRVTDERQRMAREFHDVVAHTIAAVNVQMSAAVAAFDTDPETARRALHDARDSTRDAVRDLRATVALMRREHDTQPAPRLSDVSSLADPARAAGLTVTIDDRRCGVELSAATELAAYRIIQESMTNVVRHSGARSVVISLRAESDGLVVEVVDDGRGPIPVGHDGYGLVGMVERARAVGGRVTHGRGDHGGFRVQAVLPVVG